MFSPYYGIWNPERLQVYYYHPNTYYMANPKSSRKMIEIVKYERTMKANMNIYFLTFYEFCSLDTLDFNNSLTVKNVKYDDIEIFHVPKPNANYNWNKINPTTLYWSMSQGLIKFIEQNGRTWNKI